TPGRGDCRDRNYQIIIENFATISAVVMVNLNTGSDAVATKRTGPSSFDHVRARIGQRSNITTEPANHPCNVLQVLKLKPVAGACVSAPTILLVIRAATEEEKLRNVNVT